MTINLFSFSESHEYSLEGGQPMGSSYYDQVTFLNINDSISRVLKNSIIY